MKVTVKALLIDISKEAEDEINKLMKVFSSAKRFGFIRLLEGSMTEDEKRQIWKDISRIYGLNSRQSKDALEAARRIIASQKKLLIENYNNYTKKVKNVENELKKAKSQKDIIFLTNKFDKRKNKQGFYKNHIDHGTIPKIIFGGKKDFIKRCKGQITNEEWNNIRDNNYYSRGDKEKKGNPNLRIIIKSDITFLEISILNRYKNNRAVKIQVPLYIPQKLSKKTGKINGINYRQEVLNYLKSGEAYNVELIKKIDKIYCHITIDENKFKDYKQIYTINGGVIGIDTNPNGYALTRLDRNANYKWSKYLQENELLYARSNRRDNLCGELAKQVVEIAKNEDCAIAIEDLKFKNDKDVSKEVAKIINQFSYRNLISKLERKAKKEGVEVIKVKPQFTSKIGLYKYSHQYGLNVHNSAALVIARRAFGYNDKVPAILKQKLLTEEEIIEFNTKNNWKQWGIISKKIEQRGCTTSSSWQRNRKYILGLE